MPDDILNWTARSSAIQGVKGVNNAAHPPEGSLALPKTVGLSASSLSLSIDSPARDRKVIGSEFI